jgi:hypothetical protein
MAGAASAQSVLERVLSQTASLNDVTGVFANVADNIGAGVDSVTTEPRQLAAGDIIYVGDDAAGLTVYGQVQADGSVIGVGGALAGTQLAVLAGDVVATGGAAVDVTAPIGASLFEGVEGLGLANAAGGIVGLTTPVALTTTLTQSVGLIDGSISIAAGRIDEATANVEDQITAISSVTTNFGNMATTVLGAVNTGQIGLGTNQTVEEAVADTSQAVSSVISQVGTTAASTVLALNSALNTMDIDGSISIDLDGVNASVASISPDQLDILSDGGVLTLTGVGDLLGNMNTTVLGAVNTGTIVSGVDNQVAGTIAGIVGNSATNMFGN